MGSLYLFVTFLIGFDISDGIPLRKKIIPRSKRSYFAEIRLFVGRHLRGGLICLLKSSDNMAALKIRRWAAGGHLVKMAASSHRLIFSEIEFILETFKMSTGKAQAFIKPGEPGAVEETS